MIDVEDIIDGLSEWYDDAGADSFVGEPYQDTLPDLRVESESQVFVFKVYSDILDLEDARSEWTAYDESHREWWLCLPEGLVEEAEELIEELDLENVSICLWEQSGSSFVFHDIPHPEDE